MKERRKSRHCHIGGLNKDPPLLVKLLPTKTSPDGEMERSVTENFLFRKRPLRFSLTLRKTQPSQVKPNRSKPNQTKPKQTKPSQREFGKKLGHTRVSGISYYIRLTFKSNPSIYGVLYTPTAYLRLRISRHELYIETCTDTWYIKGIFSKATLLIFAASGAKGFKEGKRIILLRGNTFLLKM
ncbi:hypothetical protein V1477_009191 [Vespula maculifrons]|uniref:Uncharacterized protein n=1 Tax=Vespula maculifrons TaxID=7453 RepID=A0ABD2CC05_VESMC